MLTMYAFECKVGAFPSLAEYVPLHNNTYTAKALSALHAEQVESSNKVMASLGGRTLSVDAGIKNAPKVRLSPGQGNGRVCTAIHTVLNEHKEVIGQYCCSNSTKELAAGLLDMRRPS